MILRSTYIRAERRAACRDRRRLEQREGLGRGWLLVPHRYDYGQEQDREGANLAQFCQTPAPLSIAVREEANLH